MNFVDEITAIMNVLKDTIQVSGELALYGLAGYAVFKLITLASYLILIKYALNRIIGWFELACLNEKDRLEVYRKKNPDLLSN